MANAAPTRAEKQYELIMECRKSGLSDKQWCSKHGINVGTFYNWVKRQRKQTGHEIPHATGLERFLSSPKQDIVRLNIENDVCKPSVADDFPVSLKHNVTIEITLGKAVIRMSNDVDSILFGKILDSIGGLSC